MSIFNPIVGIIENLGEHKFHPIVFTEYPLPGGDSPDKPIRVKSKMHHTTGFKTRQEAIDNINNELVLQLKEHFIGEPKVDLDASMAWDGEGIPALVALVTDDNKLVI